MTCSSAPKVKIGVALREIAVVVGRYQTCFRLIQEINLMDLCDMHFMEYLHGLKTFLNATTRPACAVRRSSYVKTIKKLDVLLCCLLKRYGTTAKLFVY